jgi:hypothetical protein
MAMKSITWSFLAQVSKEYILRKVIVGVGMFALLYVSLYMWHGPKSEVSAVASITNRIVQVAHQSIEGKPTLSAAFNDKVLAAAGSKAAGTGQALYDLSLKYGIDDAYALAFFQHESTFGSGGVARATLSLGNIRCSDGYQCIEGYRAYQSWQEGYEDWYRLIRTLYIGQWHLSTVEQIIPVYAPGSDHNNVAGYIAAVLKAVSTWRSEQS